MRRAILATSGLGIAIAGTAMVLCAWLALAAGGSGANTALACTPRANLADTVPAALRPLFAGAAGAYHLGPDGPAILAGLTSVESDFGKDMGPSSAGAIGWTQFLPSTWRQYGVDADGNGHADPMNAADAIYSAANYLHASGAPADWHRALLTYNHAEWYVGRVLDRARRLANGTNATAGDCAGGEPTGTLRITGGGARIVPIPGFPGERIDERLLPDLANLVARYHVLVTDGYSLDPVHKAAGEHPLGLAVDLVPGPGGSWDDIDRLAAWAEPTQNQPRPPFRWVGYNGDDNHGRGNHLHLSWQHAPAAGPPAAWVDVFSAGGAP
jgi:hypothetical protein